jgi:epoxide hydrolase-like predicted phosphatase
MKIRAVYFDLGGVIVRTEDKAPRTALAKSLGLEYNEIDQVVFGSESARRASIGTISVEQHWRNVVQSVGLPESEIERFSEAFFAGDKTDATLVDFLRSLRPKYKTGLISNAFSGLRKWIIDQKLDDAFDDLTISAEAKTAKPDALIYLRALEKLDVQPEEAIFVDDMPANIEAANALGMYGVLFKNAEQTIAGIKSLLTA